MSTFVIRFDGRERERIIVDCETIDDARNEAVRTLGNYLKDHPGFANEGHWRVNVEDEGGKPLLHVIVATVTARNTSQRQHG